QDRAVARRRVGQGARHELRRIRQRRREHLRGPDRGTAAHPPLPQGALPLGAVRGDGGWPVHGRGLRAGGLLAAGAPLNYLIAASFMAAPGALRMAKILMPEDDPDAVAREAALVSATSHGHAGRAPAATAGGGSASVDAGADRGAGGEDRASEADEPDDDDDEVGELSYSNVIDAAAGGAAAGMKLALN